MFEAFFKPPPPEPIPIDGDPPVEWIAVHRLVDWLSRADAPACGHTHKETIRYLIAHGDPIDPMLRWLRGQGGYCDCKAADAIRAKYPRLPAQDEG